MLLTVVGRRSGSRYTIPVGYVRQGGSLDILVAGKHVKAWWRNLQGGAPVEVLLRGRTLTGMAEALTFQHEPRRFTVALRNYIAQNPRGAWAVGIRDVEDLTGLRQAAGDVAMVSVRLIARQHPSPLAGEGQGGGSAS